MASAFFALACEVVSALLVFFFSPLRGLAKNFHSARISLAYFFLVSRADLTRFALHALSGYYKSTSFFFPLFLNWKSPFIPNNGSDCFIY